MLIHVAFAAFAVRAAYLLQHMASPFFARPILDQHYYDLCARQLAGEGGNLIDGFRPLLYPLVIAPFYSINADSGLFISLLAQHVLGIAMAVMVAALTSRLFESRIAGLIAGLFFALSAPPLYYEGELMIATLISFLLLVLWLSVLNIMEGRVPPRPQPAWRQLLRSPATLWLTCGIVLGLSAQARPNALPLILFFPLLTFYRWVRRSGQTASGITDPGYNKFLPLLAIPGLLLVQILFGTINSKYSGEFRLMTQAGGINFYLGNSLKADGMIPRQDRHVIYEGEYEDPIQIMAEQGFREETGTTGPLTPKVVSDHWKDKTIAEIKTDPARWLGLVIKKTWLMFWNHEAPNNRSFQFAAQHETSLLKWLPIRWWLILSLFPWGIARLVKQKKREQILWILSFLILYSGTIVLFFVNSRFRIPLWPGMAVVAGGGAAYLWSSIKSRAVPKTPVLISAVLLPLSLINWFGIPPDTIENDLFARSKAFLDRGQTEAAMEDILQCLEIAPNNPRYHFQQGNVLLAADSSQAAVSSYIRAVRLNPRDPMFHNNLGIALENIGDLKNAESAYRNALKLNPNQYAVRTNLMLLDIRTGNLERAKETLLPLLQQNGTNPTLLCARAMISYKETGNSKALEAAKTLNPELTDQLTAAP